MRLCDQKEKYRLEGSRSNLLLELRIVVIIGTLEGDDGPFIVCGIEGILRLLGEVGPVDHRLGAALVRGERQRVVLRADGVVPDKRVVAIQSAVCFEFLYSVLFVFSVLGPSQAEELGVLGVVRQPNDDLLPVMSVGSSVIRRVLNGRACRLVLGEVPGVHDAQLAVMVRGSGVDLALAAATTITRHAGGLQSAAIQPSCQFIFHTSRREEMGKTLVHTLLGLPCQQQAMGHSHS
jgi:hypothetical protein